MQKSAYSVRKVQEQSYRSIEESKSQVIGLMDKHKEEMKKKDNQELNTVANEVSSIKEMLKNFIRMGGAQGKSNKETQ